MHDTRVLVIGEIFTDQHLDIRDNNKSVSRLGGIFHAARACSSLQVEYALAYYAPAYMHNSIYIFGKEKLDAKELYRLGTIDGAPNVMLIGNSDETGNQFYDNILCNQAVLVKEKEISDIINDFSPTDIVLFPGRFCDQAFFETLNKLKLNLHIDMNYDSNAIYGIKNINAQTVFLSTSSTVFKTFFQKKSYKELIDFFNKKNVSQLIVKENRGGSWGFDYINKQNYEAPAFFMNKFIHSVGVGDVYNISFLFGLKEVKSIEERMTFAAWTSVLYAQTLDFNLFRSSLLPLIQNPSDYIQMKGIRVSWFNRKNYPIYIAAPDFDYVNSQVIDSLEQLLKYHNFNPIRPIKINGQVTEKTSRGEEDIIFSKDIKLLEDCKIMIAVLLYNDQGTLIEIGKYQEADKPVILFDPYKKINNMFFRHSISAYCTSQSQVINKLFEIMNGM